MKKKKKNENRQVISLLMKDKFKTVDESQIIMELEKKC